SAAEIVAKWPVKRVATMSFDYAYGQDVTKAFVDHLKKLKPSVHIVDQQWPKLGEQDYNPFINAQMAKKPEAVFSSIWGGFFVTYSKQAKALGVFDAIKYNFIGVGEAATPETTKSMGADYPVGIWGNSYDAFYWGETPAHRDYTARLSKYLTDAMFLFLIASGLSLIFGVLRVLNFAHGTFYMLGAYLAYQLIVWLGPGPGMFWLAALGAAVTVALLGGLIERVLFRRLYGKEELYQLLFTYALALILSDVAKLLWGTQQKSVSRPPGLTGSFAFFGAT